MEFLPTDIPDVILVRPRRFEDERGFFSEVWKQEAFRSAGIDVAWVQDNHSLSRPRGTLRGLHYQLPPFSQDKLLRVVRGSILDVAVDIRPGSAQFGRHVSVTLSATNGDQLFVPAGFAHGFVTLENDTEVLYKVSAPYAPDHDRGVLWNDPDLAIDWGFAAEDLILSAKDRVHPRLRDI
ncbi:MAG: dTDP-4-dehydrorhamnose 3,5-epimerase [Planctomycetes bacterium]|nr:dTDP-4-dehydrorhamnose 3,5-epimerase [Planctomycetota bacterium]